MGSSYSRVSSVFESNQTLILVRVVARLVAREDKSHLEIIQQRGQEKEAQWTIDEHISPRRPQ